MQFALFLPSDISLALISFPLIVGLQAFYKLLLAISEIYLFFLKVPCVQMKAPILGSCCIKSYAFLYDANISFFMSSKISLLILFRYRKSREIKYDV